MIDWTVAVFRNYDRLFCYKSYETSSMRRSCFFWFGSADHSCLTVCSLFNARNQFSICDWLIHIKATMLYPLSYPVKNKAHDSKFHNFLEVEKIKMVSTTIFWVCRFEANNQGKEKYRLVSHTRSPTCSRWKIAEAGRDLAQHTLCVRMADNI